MTLYYISAAVICYLLGSISNAIIFSRIFGVKDIRTHGSGNAGATNVLRTVGKGAAALTFLFDVLKGVVPVVVLHIIFPENNVILFIGAYSAVIGHLFPIYFGFRGGKGVSTSFGAVISVSACTGKFWIPLALLGVWLIVVALTRYVSLGSCIVLALYPVSVAMLFKGDIYYLIFAVALGLTGIIKHRANIGRLIHGTESKIGQKVK